MPALNHYTISFLHHGHKNVLHVAASSLHPADVWKHIADRLGLCYCNSEGYTMLSHAVKKMVEANGIREVRMETLDAAPAPSSSSACASLPAEAQTVTLS